MRIGKNGEIKGKALIKDITQKFEHEKRIRERELYRNGAMRVNGVCSLPVFFTYDEIESIIGEFK